MNQVMEGGGKPPKSLQGGALGTESYFRRQKPLRYRWFSLDDFGFVIALAEPVAGTA